MKINYIILENFSNIDTAMNAEKIKIDFSKAKNKIILLVGPNGSGKTSILSLLTPFASIGNLDVRNSSNLIIDGKSGYKEIEIEDKENIYLIKHFYTPKKPDGHSVKSYISKNGDELNPNGNVTSFKEWVKIELGIEMDYLKLIRLGSNVLSMITMTETERKTFMNKLLEEADVYLTFYKKVNNELRQLKDMISHAVDKQNRLGIISIEDVEDSISNFEKQLKFKQESLEKINGDISISQHIIDTMEDPYSLKTKLSELQKKVQKMSKILEKRDYESSEPDFYKEKISNLERLIEQRNVKIDATDLLIKNHLTSLDDLSDRLHKTNIQYEKEMESDEELKSMEREIQKITDDIENIKKGLNSPKPDISKDEIDKFVVFLKNMQQQLNRTYEFGLNPVKKVIKLLKNNKNVMQYINSKLYDIQSSDTTDLLLERLRRKFKFDESEIPSDCKNINCTARQVYIQIANVLYNEDDKTKEDLSTIQSMELVYQNIINILTEFQSYADIIKKLPEYIKSDFLINSIYDKISNGEYIYNDNKINDLLGLITEYHTVEELQTKKDSMTLTLSRFKKLSNTDYLIEQIKSMSETIESLEEEVSSYKKSIQDDIELNKEDSNTLELYKDLYETFTEYGDKRDELYNAEILYNSFLSNSSKIKQCNIEINKLKTEIKFLVDKIQSLKTSISQYQELQKDLNTYNSIYDEMTLVKESLSSSKGIPLRFVKNYLGNTEEITNELLDIAYNGDVYIDKFKITQSEFTIPFYNRGKLLRDVKLASQGETSFISIALAFALSSQTMHRYNIMLLDEIDSTLDIHYKEKFLKILENQIDRINSEQCFLITHGNMFSSYPVDVINFGLDSQDYKGTIEIQKY